MWGDRTPRTYPDPSVVIIDYLVAAGFDARSWYPTEATPEDSRTPMLAVLDIGAPSDGYTVTEHSVQVTGWERQRSTAVRLRSDARAALIYHPGSESVSWVHPGTMPTPVKDSVTGLWMAPFAVRIQLRALAA